MACDAARGTCWHDVDAAVAPLSAEQQLRSHKRDGLRDRSMPWLSSWRCSVPEGRCFWSSKAPVALLRLPPPLSRSPLRRASSKMDRAADPPQKVAQEEETYTKGCNEYRISRQSVLVGFRALANRIS